jgi:hypothetical protein
MSSATNPDEGWTTGRATRVCESMPPVFVQPVKMEGEDETGWVSGKVIRVCEPSPPVECVTADVSAYPALVLRVADATDTVTDVLLRVVNADWAAGGRGLTRDRSRERQEPGVVTLALVPEGPISSETETRLREVARRITSPTVTAVVIPAA